jgi:hypothetical protein
MNKVRVVGTTVLAAGVVAGGAVVLESPAASVTAARSAPKSSSVATIRLVEVASDGQEIDAKPKGESVGDYFAFHSVMENLAGKPVGRADGFGVVTAAGKVEATQHFVTLTLKGGQITTQNAPQADIENGNGPQAITGGTGQYRNARGQVTFKEQGDRVIVVVQLTR